MQAQQRETLASTTVIQGTLDAPPKKSPITVGALINEDGSDIPINALNYIVDFSCDFKIPVHLVVRSNPEGMEELLKQEFYDARFCAPVVATAQSTALEGMTKRNQRIQRISLAREQLRMQLKEAILADTDVSNLQSSIVILMDFDITLRDLSLAVDHAMAMVHDEDKAQIDVMCSTGAEPKGYYLWYKTAYYDTFATVLLPDTFTYYLSKRLNRTAYPEEDKNLIVGPSFSKFSNIDLMSWFEERGPIVPVKSCFGGMAFYRASKFLDDACAYDRPVQPPMMKYASRKEGAPCEHVVMHHCLIDHDPNTLIVVNTELRTDWHAQKTMTFNQKIFLATIILLLCTNKRFLAWQSRFFRLLFRKDHHRPNMENATGLAGYHKRWPESKDTV